MSNNRVGTIKQRLVCTQYSVIAPQQATYKARRRKGSSTPDSATKNMRDGTLELVSSGVWMGSSEHAPIQLDIAIKEEEVYGVAR